MGYQEWMSGVCFTAALGYPTAEFGGGLHNVAASQREKNTKIPFPEAAELRAGSCTQQQLHSHINNSNLSIVAKELNTKIKTSTTHPQPPPHPPALPLCRMNSPSSSRGSGMLGAPSTPTESIQMCWDAGTMPKLPKAREPLDGALASK